MQRCQRGVQRGSGFVYLRLRRGGVVQNRLCRSQRGLQCRFGVGGVRFAVRQHRVHARDRRGQRRFIDSGCRLVGVLNPDVGKRQAERGVVLIVVRHIAGDDQLFHIRPVDGFVPLVLGTFAERRQRDIHLERIGGVLLRRSDDGKIAEAFNAVLMRRTQTELNSLGDRCRINALVSGRIGHGCAEMHIRVGAVFGGTGQIHTGARLLRTGQPVRRFPVDIEGLAVHQVGEGALRFREGHHHTGIRRDLQILFGGFQIRQRLVDLFLRGRGFQADDLRRAIRFFVRFHRFFGVQRFVHRVFQLCQQRVFVHRQLFHIAGGTVHRHRVCQRFAIGIGQRQGEGLTHRILGFQIALHLQPVVAIQRDRIGEGFLHRVAFVQRHGQCAGQRS